MRTAWKDAARAATRRPAQPLPSIPAARMADAFRQSATAQFSRPATAAEAAPKARPEPRRGRGETSSRAELYEWHRRNGTLREYFRMYGRP